ncbi:MAG: hypothetical protein ACR2LX_00080 [Jatrophihabitans sp.]
MTEGATSTDPAAATPPDADPAPGIALNLPMSVVVAVVAGIGLVLTSRASALALLIAVAVMQAAMAFSWVLGTGMPGRRGALVVAAMAAAGADATVSVWPHGRLGTLLAVLGLAVPVMFVHQLARGAARVQLVSSLSAVAVLVYAEVAPAALVQLRHEFTGAGLPGHVLTAVVGAAAAALVVGYLVDLVLPLPRFDPDVPRGMIALVASAGLGAAVGYLSLRGEREFNAGRDVFIGAAIGAVAALLAVASAFVQHTTPEPESATGRLVRPVFAALLPLCVLAPAAFLLCLAVRA